jgi:hypothetical protein
MVTINEQIILANEQRYEFSRLVISRQSDNSLVGEVLFNIRNENNDVVKTASYRLAGEEFNTWWANFNNGTYLFQYLFTKLQKDVTLNESVEASFVNNN